MRISQETLLIEPDSSSRSYWQDLWHYRELFLFLAWRDILVRYKQTTFGLIWALGRPLITMLAFTLVFSRLAELPSDGVPYPLLIFTALLPWHFFSGTFSSAGDSLITNAGMISKIYFPRLVIPASTVIVNFVDFLISMIVLSCLMAWYGFMPSLRIFALPAFILLVVITAMGAGLWIAALNVKYRDFRIVIPFAIQVGLYISPVGFSSAIVPEQWRLLYSLNPLVGVIDGFRWSILEGSVPLFLPGLILSAILSTLMLVTGLMYFRKTENTFADVI